MPNDLNLFESTEWERDIGGARGTRVGAAAGAREQGCTLYELDPGGQAAPYHMHLDTGTVLALKGPADGWAFPPGSDGDYIALTLEALKADPGS